MLGWVEVMGEEIGGKHCLQLRKFLAVLGEPLEDLLFAEELSDGCKLWRAKNLE